MKILDSSLCVSLVEQLSSCSESTGCTILTSITYSVNTTFLILEARTLDGLRYGDEIFGIQCIVVHCTKSGQYSLYGGQNNTSYRQYNKILYIPIRRKTLHILVSGDINPLIIYLHQNLCVCLSVCLSVHQICMKHL